MDKYKKSALRGALYLVLFLGAFIVLLPLFWMIITACKQPGKALDFQMLPSAMYETAPKQLAKDPNEGLANITFEYDPKDYPNMSFPTRLSLAGELNGWNKDSNVLSFDGKVWSITFVNVRPGPYQYKFVVNENGWTPDRAVNPTGDDNSVIVAKPGWNFNKTLMDASKIVGDSIEFSINRPDANALQVRMINRTETTPLTKNAEGKFLGKITLNKDEETRYAILQPQSFWEGMKRIYTFNNFLKVLHAPDFPFARFFINSLVVASLCGLFTVILCTMAGYAFAKKEFIFKDILFIILMSTMMIPGMIFMVPQYAIVIGLDWINTYMGMIVPHLANIFGLFLLRQHISLIPNSFFEAAKIDGANEWHLFKYVVIPQSLPIMVTLFLMTFVGQWGNFLWQLIVNTPDSPYRTLPVGLALFKGQYAQDWEVIMAGACFSIIPIALLFLFAQRFFIEGMTKGAIKE